MIKIDLTSRYFDDFRLFKGIANSEKLFKYLERGEDKPWYPEYNWKDDKCKLIPVTSVVSIMDNIKMFFEKNIYSYEERKLFIENLIPEVENFGAFTINRIEKIIEKALLKIK